MARSVVAAAAYMRLLARTGLSASPLLVPAQNELSWYTQSTSSVFTSCHGSNSSSQRALVPVALLRQSVNSRFATDNIYAIGLQHVSTSSSDDVNDPPLGDILFSDDLGDHWSCLEPVLLPAPKPNWDRYPLPFGSTQEALQRRGAAYVSHSTDGCNMLCVIGGQAWTNESGTPRYEREGDVLCSIDGGRSWQHHAPLPWTADQPTAVSYQDNLWIMFGDRRLYNDGPRSTDSSMYLAVVNLTTCAIASWEKSYDIAVLNRRMGAQVLGTKDPDTGLPCLFVGGGMVYPGVGTDWLQNWALWRLCFQSTPDQGTLLMQELVSDALPIPPLHWGTVPAVYRRDLYALLPGPGPLAALDTSLSSSSMFWQAGGAVWYTNDGGNSFEPLPVRTWPAPSTVMATAPVLLMHATAALDSQGMDYLLATPYPASGLRYGRNSSQPEAQQQQALLMAAREPSVPYIAALYFNSTVTRMSVGLCRDPCAASWDEGLAPDVFSTGCGRAPTDAVCKACTKCGLAAREIVPCAGATGLDFTDRTCAPQALVLLLSVSSVGLDLVWTVAGTAPALSLLLWGGAAAGLSINTMLGVLACRCCSRDSTSKRTGAVDWLAATAKPGRPKAQQGSGVPGISLPGRQGRSTWETALLVMAASLCATAVGVQIVLGLGLAFLSRVGVDETASGGASGSVAVLDEGDMMTSVSRLLAAAEKLPAFVGSILLLSSCLQPLVCSIAAPAQLLAGRAVGTAGYPTKDDRTHVSSSRMAHRLSYASPRLMLLWAMLHDVRVPSRGSLAVSAVLTNDAPVGLALAVPLFLGTVTGTLYRASLMGIGLTVAAALVSISFVLVDSVVPWLTARVGWARQMAAGTAMAHNLHTSGSSSSDGAIVVNPVRDIRVTAMVQPHDPVPAQPAPVVAGPVGQPESAAQAREHQDSPSPKTSMLHVFASPGMGTVTWAPPGPRAGPGPTSVVQVVHVLEQGGQAYPAGTDSNDSSEGSSASGDMSGGSGPVYVLPGPPVLGHAVLPDHGRLIAYAPTSTTGQGRQLQQAGPGPADTDGMSSQYRYFVPGHVASDVAAPPRAPVVVPLTMERLVPAPATMAGHGQEQDGGSGSGSGLDEPGCSYSPGGSAGRSM